MFTRENYNYAIDLPRDITQDEISMTKKSSERQPATLVATAMPTARRQPQATTATS